MRAKCDYALSAARANCYVRCRNIHPADRSSPATDLPPKLSDLGITKKGIIGLANDWPQSPRANLKPLSGTVRPQSLEGSRESRNGVGPRHPMPANNSGRVIRMRDNRLLAKHSQTAAGGPLETASVHTALPLGKKVVTVHGPSSREMKATKILCRKCRVGWVAHDERCSQCGYNEEREERMGRLVRNSLILLVSVLAVIWLIHRN